MDSNLLVRVSLIRGAYTLGSALNHPLRIHPKPIRHAGMRHACFAVHDASPEDLIRTSMVSNLDLQYEELEVLPLTTTTTSKYTYCKSRPAKDHTAKRSRPAIVPDTAPSTIHRAFLPNREIELVEERKQGSNVLIVINVFSSQQLGAGYGIGP